MSSVSNGLYFLTLPLVCVMRVIYRKIRHARYLYIKRNVEKVWGARYTLGARYLSKNTVTTISLVTELGVSGVWRSSAISGIIRAIVREDSRFSSVPVWNCRCMNSY